jgi:hypothetical protein
VCQCCTLPCLVCLPFLPSTLCNIHDCFPSLTVPQVRAAADGSAVGASAGDDESELFPNFMWVVRDFGVRLERNGVKLSAREYLEDALTVEPGSSEATEQKNAVRTVLRRFFPQRDCMTMVCVPSCVCVCVLFVLVCALQACTFCK